MDEAIQTLQPWGEARFPYLAQEIIWVCDSRPESGQEAVGKENNGSRRKEIREDGISQYAPTIPVT